jgi:hypothetical protein
VQKNGIENFVARTRKKNRKRQMQSRQCFALSRQDAHIENKPQGRTQKRSERNLRGSGDRFTTQTGEQNGNQR